MATLYEREREFRARVILDTVRECGGVRAQAARELGLTRTYFCKIVRELGLVLPPSPRPHQTGRMKRAS